MPSPNISNQSRGVRVINLLLMAYPMLVFLLEVEGNPKLPATDREFLNDLLSGPGKIQTISAQVRVAPIVYSPLLIFGQGRNTIRESHSLETARTWTGKLLS